MLDVEHLEVAHGDAVAVWDVSLAVGAGELVTVVGPNGAGKTTLIDAIAGLLPVRGGRVRLDGRDLASAPAHALCGQGIALVPEGRRLFPAMTVEENLEMGCYAPAARARRHPSLERVYEIFPILRERRRQLAGSLSGGQQQMVAIGRALMAMPRLLLLDEPSLGLAPQIVDQVFEVVVEQNIVQAFAIAARAYVLEQGRIVAEGTPSELAQDARIREAYLGQQ
jgi:branched-chain amino acid transport system ATP-binding protein